MDRATFDWVFTFLALNRKDALTENSIIIYATLVNLDEKELVQSDSSKLIEVLSLHSVKLQVIAELNESENFFNDMGYMQAIDVITAIEAIKIILKENDLIFDNNRVVGYGHSHGAYLLHLCNGLVPNLFSHIIDNSAWIEPVYLQSNRYLVQSYGSMTLQIEFDYLAKSLIEDKNALNLETIYKDFDNRAKMIVFQGTNDNLINHNIKRGLFHKILNAEFLLIGEKEVDNQIFKSNRHGLDADFLRMFDFALSHLGNHINTSKHHPYYELVLSKTKISVDYTQGLPVFTMVKI